MAGGIPLNQVQFTDHFIKQAKSKGFKADDIRTAIESPERITDVRRYPGQRRHIGAGLAIVMHGNRAITGYLDGVVTPLRPDQMNDPAARNSRRLSRA